jgi:4-hydroxy-tetrahydrodipicolinate reductase
MNLFIFGLTGRMGRSLIACAAEHTDVLIVQTLESCDVVLDFSVSEAAQTHIQNAHAARKPFVLGTTGLPAAAFDTLTAASRDIPIIQSANFSLGIALCLESAKRIGQILEHAHIEIFETHHAHKKDRPSGTALALAKALHVRETTAIHSRREGETVGEHHIIVTTPHETLEIKHTAHSRAAFAAGAIEAARWLLTQPAGLYIR